MPAKSEKQRKFMGAAYGAKKSGSCSNAPSASTRKACESMSSGQLRDFAKKKGK